MQKLELNQEKLFDIILRHYNIPKHEKEQTKIELKLEFDLEPRLIDHYYLDYECKDPHDKERAKGIKYINAPKGNLSLRYGRTIENLTDTTLVNAHLELAKPFPITSDEANCRAIRRDFVNDWTETTEKESIEDTTKLNSHSQEAEQAVLGAILANAEECKTVMEVLRQDDFYRPAHSTIFKAMEQCLTNGQDPDCINVSALLKTTNELDNVGGRYYLGLLLSHAPKCIEAGRYASIIVEHAATRRKK